MNVLVLFPNDYDFLFLNTKKFPEHTFFYEGDGNIVSKLDQFCIRSFIEEVKQKYNNINGIICTQDYPGMLVTSLLACEWGLPTCKPETTITLQHKYYSRTLQKKCLPHNTPLFTIVSAKDSLVDFDFCFPCFVKPVKAVFSYLSTRVESKKDLIAFIKENKQALEIFSQPFNEVIKDHSLFDFDGNYFIVEELLEGVQVTLDGFADHQSVHIMGIVDSIKYPGTESFHSFEYPSKLSWEIQQQMIKMAKTFVENTNYYGMFNIEMFYNTKKDRVDILELNPRMFFAAADYFEKVDGINTYETCLSLAMGKKPIIQKQKGKFEVAATFTPRLFEDKLVKRIPTPNEITALKKEYPDLILKIEHKVGQKLSNTAQGAGSYKYAVLNLGGKNWEDLYEKFENVKNKLCFEFASLD